MSLQGLIHSKLQNLYPDVDILSDGGGVRFELPVILDKDLEALKEIEGMYKEIRIKPINGGILIDIFESAPTN
jgi:hypothetical protein